ncbi:MAG: hypothetical protein PVJ53_16130, partial [Desulfobacterales bacterium]
LCVQSGPRDEIYSVCAGDAGGSMEFKNLQRNILDTLGERYSQKDQDGPFTEDYIFECFSDLPRESVKAALEDLRRAGLLSAGDVRKQMMLTKRGLSCIAVSKET